MTSPTKSKKKDDREIRYVFRIAKDKFICAKPEEMAGYEMKYGSLCDSAQMIRI